jgi:sarcosine oxidase, subunit beta
MPIQGNSYDVIVIGSGSIGAPTAYFLSKEKLKVLVVDERPSAGQGSNKTAIGGIRATHSDFSKISLCTKSIEIFSNWQKETGVDIEWRQGGYIFPVYDEQDQITLKQLLLTQKEYGLNIEWLSRELVLSIVPDLSPNGLRGGTFSPGDGSASPLLANHAFCQHAIKRSTDFKFNTKVQELLVESGSIRGVGTNQGCYHAPIVINAGGAWAGMISKKAGLDLPIHPDSHEAGITEPVARFFEPMVVDIRGFRKSANFYFYQHQTGQIVFCVTPNPNQWGFDTRETSEFLPLAATRLINIMPRLGNIRIRRTWRGLYPMTPDGLPIIGEVPSIRNLFLAVGMCGQGFMLGPGVGELLARMVKNGLTANDQRILKLLSPIRNFSSSEMLK